MAVLPIPNGYIAAIQVIYSLYTKIVDIFDAFRIPKLEEKVYIELPEGMKQDSSKVLLLNNSLYGLKQAAHEAEYIAISTAASMSQSIKQIFEELDIPMEVVLILNDNQSAITIANSEFSSSKLRHVKVHFHFVKELIKQNQIKVSYVSTTDNITDIMTKALSKDKFQKIRGLMGFAAEDNTYQLEEGVSETDLLISNN